MSSPAPPHLTCAQKLATASALYWSASQLKRNALRRTRPDLSAEQLEDEVRRIFLLSESLNR